MTREKEGEGWFFVRAERVPAFSFLSLCPQPRSLAFPRFPHILTQKKECSLTRNMQFASFLRGKMSYGNYALKKEPLKIKKAFGRPGKMWQWHRRSLILSFLKLQNAKYIWALWLWFNGCAIRRGKELFGCFFKWTQPHIITVVISTYLVLQTNLKYPLRCHSWIFLGWMWTWAEGALYYMPIMTYSR